VLARIRSQLDWYWTLSPPGRAAFWATFSGWALDAYNQMTLGFILPAVTAAFALSTTQGGLIGTVGGVTSAIGGALAGALADTIGRVRVLLLSIGSYAVFTFLAGCAQSYEQLLVFSTLQGLGFGGEWAAGAVLVAEYAQATQRGRVIGAVQSAWSIGYALVLIANTVTFSLAPPELAWRIMFWLGADRPSRFSGRARACRSHPSTAPRWLPARPALDWQGQDRASRCSGCFAGTSFASLWRRRCSRLASSAQGSPSGCRPIWSRCGT
jgi:hypothetical protein